MPIKKAKKVKKVTKSKPRAPKVSPKKPKMRQTRKPKSVPTPTPAPAPAPPSPAATVLKESMKSTLRKFTLKAATPIENVTDYDARTKLPVLVSEVRDLDDAIKAILAENADALEAVQTQRGELLEEIKEIVVKADLTTVEGEDWRLSYVTGVRRSLDPKLLLEKGVTMSIIKACTVEKETKPYLRIGPKSEAAEETAEESAA